MAQREMKQGRCPKCQEVLEIPANLTEFSCMYCGERLTQEMLLPVTAPVDTTTVDGKAAAAFYHNHVLKAIIDYQGIEKEMTKAKFPTAFNRYQDGNRKTFEQLDLAVAVGELSLEDASTDLLDQMAARWDRDAKRYNRAAMMDTDKFILAIYLIPMVQELNLSISTDYCQTLHALWMERYPKSPFTVGTYEALANGFQKRYFGLCFITTAVCRHDGKPDDCAELTAFRTFRDGYLRACPDGPDLIDEYYDIAPGIVTHIELSQDCDQVYDHIRDHYLVPCFTDIQQGKLAQCKERYTAMVQNLKAQYLS